MASLMPIPERTLALPVALVVPAPRALPLWLRDCVAAAQGEALAAQHAAACHPDREECGHELLMHEWRAGLELLADVWQDALCPDVARRVPVFLDSFSRDRRAA